MLDTRTLPSTIAVLVLCALVGSVAFGSASAETTTETTAGDSGVPFEVGIKRGDHGTLSFWPSWRDPMDGIQGRLTGLDGSPVKNLNVSLVPFQPVGDQLEDPLDLNLTELNERVDSAIKILPALEGETDSNGQFRFADLKAGLYSLQIDWGSLDSQRHPMVILQSALPKQGVGSDVTPIGVDAAFAAGPR